MATQVSLTDGAVASAGALDIQTNGTTQAISISTGQVATLAQNPILTSGTANGVAYLNGSKAVTSGSALVFDGTNLGLGVTPSAYRSSEKAFQVGSYSSFSDVGGYTIVGSNYYTNSSNQNIYRNTAAATAYGQTAGQHQWFTVGSGTAGASFSFTQAMTLDASGNLGVGTTSPTYKITVKGGNANNLLVDNDGSQYTQLLMQRNSTANTGGDLLVDGTNGLMSLRMLAVGSLRFCTSASAGDGTERARIDSSGNLLVGTTSHTDGSIFQTTTTTPLNSYRATATASGGIYGAYSDVGGTKTVRAYFRADGGLANYSANDVNLSDERLKKDISIAGSYLEKICAIPVKTFRYKDQSNTEDLTIGVIAQDVLAIAPELVSQDGFGLDEKENYLSVYQTDLQYALMKCIQEQQALITQLQADVAALKGA